MSNSYYNASGAPSQGSSGSSATVRGEFNAIVAGFDKLPTLGANGGHVVIINPGSTGMTSSSALAINGATVTVTGDLTVTGALTLAGLSVPAGTVSAPGAAFAGDADNGWWRPAADTQAWSLAGAEVMRLNAAGLGIGVTPAEKLHVQGNAARFGDGVYTGYVGKGSALLTTGAAADFAVYSSGGKLLFGTGANLVRATIDASGNVGIGTTAPQKTFVIANGTAAGLEFSPTDYAGNMRMLAYDRTAAAYVALRTEASQYEWLIGGSEKMRLDTSGNLLVGVATGNGTRLRVDSGGAPWHTFGASSAAASYGQYFRGGTITIGGYIGFDGGALVGTGTGTGFVIRSEADLILMSAATERLRIDSSGRVGIGIVPIPGVPLTVHTGVNRNVGILDQASQATITSLTDAGSPAPLRVVGNTLSFSGDGSTDHVTINASGALSLLRAGVGLSQSVSVSGGVVEWDLINTSNTANSQSSLFMQVAGASAGDNFVRMNINGVQDWSFGVDNSDSDAFVIAASSALGAGNVLRISTAGVITDTAGLELGYKDIPRTTVGLTRGQALATAAGFTLNTGPAAGSTYSVYNDSAAAITITQGAGLTLRLGGTATTGSRTLGARGFATIWFNSTTEAIIQGSGVS